MCGPIVEVVDERLQFVHFTAQEYIFSTDISFYIDKGRTTGKLTTAILAYLGSGVLQPELDDEEIQANILSGNYRLLDYASFYWPTLLHMMSDVREGPSDVEKALDRFARRGRNDDFTNAADGPSPLYKNEFLRKVKPEVYEMALAAFNFHVDEKRWDWNWGNSNSWMNFDPFITSQMLAQIREQYETLLSDPDHLESLRFHYGKQLYKCTYLFCPHNRRGFESRHEREMHLKHHGLLWKCLVLRCDWATIGFDSKKRRDEHWLKYHLPNLKQLLEPSGANDFENLYTEELQPLLFRLVMEDNFESVQRLVTSSSGKKLKAEVIGSARLMAAKQGSLAMTKILSPEDETHAPPNIIISAVQSDDVDFVKWALSKASPDGCTKFMKAMLGTKSEEIYTLWEEYILDNLQNPKVKADHKDKEYLDSLTENWKLGGYSLAQEYYESLLQKWRSNFLGNLFKQSLFTNIKGIQLEEARVKHTLRKVRKYMDIEMRVITPVRIAKSSCTLSLVEEMLNLGAPINYPAGGTVESSYHGMSALQAAAKKTSKEAALLMQLLILRGADNFMRDKNGKIKSIGLEKGAAVIAKWLNGVTWDDLIKQREDSIKQLDRQS